MYLIMKYLLMLMNILKISIILYTLYNFLKSIHNAYNKQINIYF